MPKPYRNDAELIKMKEFYDGIQDQLRNHLKKLKELDDIKCEIADDKAITGTYRNEPFVVYYLIIGTTGNEFAGILKTRWRGKDHEKIAPVSVLKGV